MSEFIIPLRRVMLLQHVLENGGTTRCSMQRPETSIDAHVEIENDLRTHQVKATFGPLTGSITLQRGDSSKYMDLRDFLQDLANGRTESGQQSEQAVAMREAFESVNAVLEPEQVAYISPTDDPAQPFRVIVLDVLGDICAHTKGHCKDQLVEAVRQQLRPTSVGHGEHQ
ncbi:hypothetical protein [Pseudomonas monteilii]|uniref:hypothetical protein n=1 Tax=Pseudomonas monteilii TaxID=76759 RepID=UPI00048A6B49|nr:hypothetical protein [Pseudomonas monteilii]KPM60212.1 hypothetical protein HB4184_22145 [Pseudomonas putida]MBA6089205.1 hypothetical protein [Pseudomonas monteilii]